MAYERSLLERISSNTPDTCSIEFNEAKVVESILKNVTQILNTRQGSVPTSPDYGLPDFNDLAKRFPNAIGEIKISIRNALEKYEPRLTNLHVDHVDSENKVLDLRYDVKAQIVLNGDRPDIWFETILDSAGKVSIKG